MGITTKDEQGIQGMRTAGRLADWVAERADTLNLHDLAYTLARRRAHRPVRTTVLHRSRPTNRTQDTVVTPGPGSDPSRQAAPRARET